MDWRPDPFLVGNGAWCSGCFPNGPPVGMRLGAAWKRKARPGCNQCAGEGRILFSLEEIVADSLPVRRSELRMEDR